MPREGGELLAVGSLMAAMMQCDAMREDGMLEMKPSNV